MILACALVTAHSICVTFNQNSKMPSTDMYLLAPLHTGCSKNIPSKENKIKCRFLQVDMENGC